MVSGRVCCARFVGFLAVFPTSAVAASDLLSPVVLALALVGWLGLVSVLTAAWFRVSPILSCVDDRTRVFSALSLAGLGSLSFVTTLLLPLLTTVFDLASVASALLLFGCVAA